MKNSATIRDCYCTLSPTAKTQFKIRRRIAPLGTDGLGSSWVHWHGHTLTMNSWNKLANCSATRGGHERRQSARLSSHSHHHRLHRIVHRNLAAWLFVPIKLSSIPLFGHAPICLASDPCTGLLCVECDNTSRTWIRRTRGRLN